MITYGYQTRTDRTGRFFKAPDHQSALKKAKTKYPGLTVVYVRKTLEIIYDYRRGNIFQPEK